MASRERTFTFTENNGVYTVQSYGTILSSYGYQYDECNNLSKLTCSVAGSSWNTVYTYDKDNRPKKTILNSGVEITNTYNAIGLVSSKTIGLTTPYETKIFYLDLGNGKRAPLIDYYKNGSEYATHYEYDDNGNITKIERSDGANPITYEYDVANRLTRENNSILNQTITYDYDDFGNITEKNTYAYTTAQNPGTIIAPAITYVYDDSDEGWGDQLIEYNGQTITYDEMGNPTTYRGYTFGWRGKQLTSASNGTNTLTFEYNEDGLRQQKTVNNVDTDYFYNGTVLIGMQKGTDTLLLSYDAFGNVVSVKYITANDTNEYYYLRNAQNDVVKLIDASGIAVVEYTYDTWGKKVSTTGTLAGTLGLIQPFRYRGYVYDEETALYYLQSRYYDPTTGRFISADVLLSTGQGVLGHNCYAYCNDNPVNMQDDGGSIPHTSQMEADQGYIDFVPKATCEEGYNKVFLLDAGQEDEALHQFRQDNKVFYRGAKLASITGPIFTTSCTFLGTIHIHENDLYFSAVDLKHEYGHILQERRYGFTKYMLRYGVPSACMSILSGHSSIISKIYYDLFTERSADDLGNVTEEDRTHQSWSLPLSRLYDIISFF